MGPWFKSVWKKRYVWITIVGVNSLMMMQASVVSWSSAAIPKLEAQGTVVNEQLTNNLGIVLLGGSVTGSIFSFFLFAYVGHKLSLILTQLCFTFSWIFLFFQCQEGLIYLGRFLGGLALSCTALILPAYEAEVFHPKDRQISGGLMSIYCALGLMLEYSLAPFISYNCVIFINLFPTLVFLLVFTCFGKESPYHLVKSGKLTQAEHVVYFFWNNNATEEQINDELKDIREIVEEERKMTKFQAFRSIFTDRANSLSCLLALVTLIFFTSNGNYQVTMYLEEILTKARISQMPVSVASAVIGSVKPFGALASLPLIGLLGVRLALVTSLIGYLISMLSIGTYFYIQKEGLDTNFIYWLPVLSLAVYFFCNLMGGGVLPYVVRGELLPRHLRGPAGSLTDICSGLISFPTNSFFVGYIHLLYIPFWAFAGLILAQIVFTLWCIPETKGKSLYQIQNDFKNKE